MHISNLDENQIKYNNILSHIDPDRPLYKHLHDVAIGCKELFLESHFDFNNPLIENLVFNNKKAKDHEINEDSIETLNTLKEDIIDLSIISGICHDFGKGTIYFQNYLSAQKNKKDFRKTDLSKHASISSIFGLVLSKKMIDLSKNQEYLKQNAWLGAVYNILPYIIYFIIKSHHINLDNFLDLLDKEESWEIESQQMEDLSKNDNFKQLFIDLIGNIISENIFNNYHFKDLNIEELYTSIFNLSKDIVNKPQAIIDPVKYLSVKRTIRTSTDFKYFLFFLIKFLFSILINSDKMNTVFDTHQFDRMENFPFLEELNNYRSKKHYDKFSSIEISGEILKNDFKNKSEWLKLLKSKLFKICNDNLNEIIGPISGVKNLEKNIFLIDLPTGLGKTLISLSVAFTFRDFYQTKYHISPRIIYALPFLSIIDQNYSVIEEILSIINEQTSNNLILNQHHLSENTYSLFKGEEDYDSNAKRYTEHEANLLIEGWESELVVTTFHQFLNTIFSNSNKLNRRFHHYYGSIVILDEVQTIPSKYWNLLKKIFGILTSFFNIKLIIITATLPRIFPVNNSLNLLKMKDIPLINDPSKQNSENKESESDLIQRELYNLNRIQINVDFNTYSIQQFIDKIIETTNINTELKEGNIKTKILIVLNTRRSAKLTYQTLINTIKTYTNIESLEDKIFFLSSEIIPKNRLEIIKNIKDSEEGTILVSTQVIEAGVDLDFQYVFRDFAPLDSLIQVSGRCNRNNKNIEGAEGKVFVYNLNDEINDDNDDDNNENERKHQKESKNLFSYQIYDPILLNFTKEAIIENSSYHAQNANSVISLNEQEFYKIIEKYYQKLDNYLSNHQEKIFEENIEKLKFTEIAKDFQLIENMNSYPIFIEIDDNASSLIFERNSIITKYKGFELKHKLKDIGVRMNQYTINININKSDLEIFKEKLRKYNITFSEDQMIFIPKSCVSNFYGKTGIIMS